jgi:hypothetical protein
MKKTGQLLLVVAGWTSTAALIGWIIFNTIYVEHGSILLWLVGIFIGFIVGLVHMLVLIGRWRATRGIKGARLE